MLFFDPAQPILRFKQHALDIQDRVGLLKIHWQLGHRTVFSRFYTRIDQAFLIWGIIVAIIFGVAQFCPLSWMVQASLWTVLTLIGVAVMVALTWFWVTIERLRWIVYGWAGLMLLGILLTDLAIWGGWWQLLAYLCPLWLGLSAIGYLFTGLGMQSRTFLITCGIHLLGMMMLSYVVGWQFLATGLVMASSLVFLSEVQWDMRPPIAFDLLTPAQRAFNQEQHQLRQLA